MATIVSTIPSIARDTKYNYDELFDGQARRLVAGEDFTVSNTSFRGALYARKAQMVKNGAEPFSVSVKFREETTEDGKTQRVAYVQKTEAKVRKAKPAKVEAKPAAKKAPAKKATAKVTPNPKEDRKPVTPSAGK